MAAQLLIYEPPLKMKSGAEVSNPKAAVLGQVNTWLEKTKQKEALIVLNGEGPTLKQFVVFPTDVTPEGEPVVWDPEPSETLKVTLLKVTR